MICFREFKSDYREDSGCRFVRNYSLSSIILHDFEIVLFILHQSGRCKSLGDLSQWAFQLSGNLVLTKSVCERRDMHAHHAGGEWLV